MLLLSSSSKARLYPFLFSSCLISTKGYPAVILENKRSWHSLGVPSRKKKADLTTVPTTNSHLSQPHLLHEPAYCEANFKQSNSGSQRGKRSHILNLVNVARITFYYNTLDKHHGWARHVWQMCSIHDLSDVFLPVGDPLPIQDSPNPRCRREVSSPQRFRRRDLKKRWQHTQITRSVTNTLLELFHPDLRNQSLTKSPKLPVLDHQGLQTRLHH